MMVLPELLPTFDASLLVITSFVASYITAALGIGGGLFRFWFRWIITLLALRMLLIGGSALLA